MDLSGTQRFGRLRRAVFGVFP